MQVIIFLLVILIDKVAWLMRSFSHCKTNDTHNLLSLENIGFFMSTSKNRVELLNHFLVLVLRLILLDIYHSEFIRHQIAFILRALWIPRVKVAFFFLMKTAEAISKIFLFDIILKGFWFFWLKNWQVMISSTIYTVLTRYYS